MTIVKDNCCAVDALERVRFFPRQLVTPEDLNDQTSYLVEKMRRHNRFVHGFGIACGLDVTRRCENPDEEWPCDPEAGYAVTVHPGYALTPCGDEVQVTTALNLDLTSDILNSTSACPPKPADLATKKIYLVLRPVACPTRPVRVQSANCGCGDAPCEFSRVREGFEYGVLAAEPPIYKTRRDYWREHRRKAGSVPCWGCPPDNWVVISELTLTTDRLLVGDNKRYVLPSVLVAGLLLSSL